MDTRNESYRLHQLRKIRIILDLLDRQISPEAAQAAERHLLKHLENSRHAPRQGALWGGA